MSCWKLVRSQVFDSPPCLADSDSPFYLELNTKKGTVGFFLDKEDYHMPLSALEEFVEACTLRMKGEDSDAQ